MKRRQVILKIVENDEMKIERLCSSKCLFNCSEVVYLFLNNTIEEVSEILNMPIRTVNNKIDKFIKTFTNES